MLFMHGSMPCSTLLPVMGIQWMCMNTQCVAWPVRSTTSVVPLRWPYLEIALWWCLLIYHGLTQQPVTVQVEASVVISKLGQTAVMKAMLHFLGAFNCCHTR